MEVNLRQYLLAGTMLAGGALLGTPAMATVTACPAVGYDTECGIVIDITNSGVTITATGQGPYDGVDDTLVGLTNNTTSTTIKSVFLSSKTDIGGFDGDGIATNPNPTSGKPGLVIPGDTGPLHGTTAGQTGGPGAPKGGYSGTDSTTGTYNLSGPLNSYSNNLIFSLDVNFPGGIAPGGSAFFSLEEALTAASFTGITANPGVPEPATLSILGAALAGFGLVRRRRKT